MAKPKTPPPPTMQEIAVKLRDRFVEVAGSVANDVNMEAVTHEVIKDLNASKREVTLKMLGLDNRWGKWEVDHCNSRKSPVQSLIDDTCMEMVTTWVNDTIKEVLTDEMKKKIKANIKAAFLSEIGDRHSYHARKMISEHAENIVTQMITDIKREIEVELGIKE
jgi:hypothetical protein